MFVRDLIFLQKPVLTGVALLFTAVAVCAEPVSNQVEKAESVVEPRTLERSNSSRLFRPYLPSNPFSDSTKFTPRPNVSPVPRQNAPSTTRRQDELLDRQRNWIFVSPDDKDKTDSVEEAIGVGGMFESKKSQSVVSRFLSNGRQNMGDQEGGDHDIFSNQSKFDSNNLFQGLEDPLQRPDLFDQGRAERISGFDAEQTKLSEMWRDQFGADALKMRQEKQTRMQEFENMFRSQKSVVTAGNGSNPLNASSLQPISPSRTVTDRYSPRPYESSLDRLKNVPPPAPGIFERPTPNARVFGVSATPPSVVETTKPERPPAVLTIPKRRL